MLGTDICGLFLPTVPCLRVNAVMYRANISPVADTVDERVNKGLSPKDVRLIRSPWIRHREFKSLICLNHDVNMCSLIPL